jgi:hypothetical protein
MEDGRENAMTSGPSRTRDWEIETFLAIACPDDDGNYWWKKPRKGNEHRDRQKPLEFVATWSDALFYKAFRMTRNDFCDLRESIKEVHRPRDVKMAKLSSGSMVSAETKLIVTLRTLAGACAVDLIHWGVACNHVNTYVEEMLWCLNTCSLLQNINMPNTEVEVRHVQEEWEAISMRKFGDIMLPGTLVAVDGLVVAIRGVCKKDVELFGIHADRFFNRKGYPALIVQVVCDAYTQVRAVEARWPGSVNDHIAFKQMAVHEMFTDPENENFALYERLGATMLADEAYISLGGRILCPYSQSQLRHFLSRDKSKSLWESAKVFMNRQSGQRITVERCLGQTIRQWGCLWRPIEYRLEYAQLMIIVAFRLHNLTVIRWKRTHHIANVPDVMPQGRRQQQDDDENVDGPQDGLDANVDGPHALDADLLPQQAAVPADGAAQAARIEQEAQLQAQAVVRDAPQEDRKPVVDRQAATGFMPELPALGRVREMANVDGVNDPDNNARPAAQRIMEEDIREKLRERLREKGFKYNGPAPVEDDVPQGE